MKITQYKIIAIIVLIILIIVFFFSRNINNDHRQDAGQNLLTLNCSLNKFEIKGDAYNSTTGWGMHDYEYNLSLFLNDKLIQSDKLAKRYSPPLLKSYEDKYKLYTVYYLPIPISTDISTKNILIQNNLSVYMSAKDFSKSEYEALVNCIKNNHEEIKTVLRKIDSFKPSGSSKEYPIRTVYSDILMTTYGDVYSDITLTCSSAKTGWIVSINPRGQVFEKDTKSGSGGSLGDITTVNDKEVWGQWQSGIDEKNKYEFLKTCVFPDGQKFFDKYSPLIN